MTDFYDENQGNEFSDKELRNMELIRLSKQGSFVLHICDLVEEHEAMMASYSTPDTLKFENKFQIGDKIKAYDFQPMQGRKDCYVEGIITAQGTPFKDGVKFITIEATYDSWDEENLQSQQKQLKNPNSRVGQEVFVAMELTFMEFDERITKI